MIYQITKGDLTYWEYRDYRFTLFAFSLVDLLRDLEEIYDIRFQLFNFNLS